MIELLPTYTDGRFSLFEIVEHTPDGSDYPERLLKNLKMIIWYRELAVFDRLRHEFDQTGTEITKKIRIPYTNIIKSGMICQIDGAYHLVYNSAVVVDRKSGIKETELTLIRPGEDIVSLKEAKI